jgi:carbonic anhydrase
MDVRIDPLAALGLAPGDAHVLRNAGAVVTDDVLRSLILSQRLLGTRSIAVIAHTDCGLHDLRDDELASQVAWETGTKPHFQFGSFHDLDDHVRAQLVRVRTCVWLAQTDDARGYVLDVADGSVRSVDG